MCVFGGSRGGGLPFSTSELSAPEITLCSPESDGEKRDYEDVFGPLKSTG